MSVSTPAEETYRLVRGVPDAVTYCRLRRDAGLSPKAEQAAVRGLANTIFGVTIRFGADTVGMGRLVGDGGTAFQIVDIAVLPAHQGRGLGKRIMAALTDHIDVHLDESAYISLIADGDAARLYAQYGFTETAPASVGMARRGGKRL